MFKKITVLFIISLLMLVAFSNFIQAEEQKEFAYLTPGLNLPFWKYLSIGIKDGAKEVGAKVLVYDSNNDPGTQLRNAQDAIARNVDGIFISPTDSSTCPGVLRAAKRANIPVVISDVGTDSGEYVSFIITDNKKGAYKTGQIFAQKLKEEGWSNGPVGLVTISLARQNGKERTAGFKEAMKEANIEVVALKEMKQYSGQETYKFVQDMLTAYPELHGIFVETDNPTLGAVRAVKTSGREDSVLVMGFDGIPAFVDMIKNGEIVGSGMQQPWLYGKKSFETMWAYLQGEEVPKRIEVPIKVITKDNLSELLPVIKETVFANEME